MKKRVAVIGCGVVGLTAIKACKEAGLEVVCYEQSDDIGGLWKYKESNEEGVASVTKSTIINTSKELTSFSDFPPPKEFPNYMHNTLMFRYLQMYAEHFDLVAHVKFRHRVVDVEQSEDYDATGRWIVSALNPKTGENIRDRVDAVMICNGHHVFPNIPKFPGQEKFRGRILHTRAYRRSDEFRDGRVAVVGTGNSGADAAVETCTVAKRVYWSTRRGCWVINRVGKCGKPNDEYFLTRCFDIASRIVPTSISSWWIESELNRSFDHEAYQLKPKHRFFQQHPTVNDSIANCILSGRITVKGDVQRFEENGIVFQGDSHVTEVDYVILATGYDIKFPFLSKNIIDTTDNRVELYKLVYPTHLKHPTLGVIGLSQAVGASFPIHELQCRWFVQVLSKKVPFPSKEEMKEDVEKRKRELETRYYDSKRHTIQIDYIGFADEIAALIGAKPNFWKMFFTDPKLFWALMLGPSLPYQYRLQGPHSWDKARETILGYEERARYPLQTRFKTRD
ncbi:flavin-containing monooxygenase 5-like [Centruroides vittatus]|uniref:flavin-containing monooxygenase 5-like n=1 Tax=Centruroides vittatus TaxID=120091 RepID=UPI00350F984A